MFLVAKRVYEGELVPLLTKRLHKAACKQKLEEIAAFPGVLVDGHSYVSGEGELWFEGEAENGDLVIDPVCFPAKLAHETLVRTGVKPQEATRLLSDEYAGRWVTDRY